MASFLDFQSLLVPWQITVTGLSFMPDMISYVCSSSPAQPRLCRGALRVCFARVRASLSYSFTFMTVGSPVSSMASRVRKSTAMPPDLA